MEPSLPDNAIQVRLAANDPLALELLWTAYAADLLGYLVSLLRSQPDAEDVLQEVFYIRRPQAQRTVIVMEHYREKTFQEIGEALGISMHTVGSRYRYGLEKLRQRLLEAQL